MRALVGLACLMVLVGCMGKPAQAPTPTTTSATPTLPTAAVVGAIEGRVVDEERLPLPGVEITTSPDIGAGQSDEAGTFRLEGLPEGPVTVSAYKAGYDLNTLTVVVLGDETVRADFFMIMASEARPYHMSFPHTAHHHYGNGYLDAVMADTIGSAYEGCEGCSWAIDLGRAPDAVLVEVRGAHAVEDAAHGDREFIVLESGTNPKTLLFGAQAALPIRIEVDAQKLAQSKPTTLFSIRLQCDAEWFCYDERREVWFTTFVNEQIPEGFSAFAS